MEKPNQEEILKQAKKIIDSFHNALKGVEHEASEARVERDEFERTDGEGKEADKEFREIMFKNAGKNKNECIEAERGKWI